MISPQAEVRHALLADGAADCSGGSAAAGEDDIARWTAAHRRLAAERDAADAADAAATAARAPQLARAAADIAAVPRGGANDAVVAVPASVPTAADAPDAIPSGMTMPSVPGGDGAATIGGAARAALLSQLAIAPGDAAADDAAFPKGARDASCDSGQQLDQRRVNSWMLKVRFVPWCLSLIPFLAGGVDARVRLGVRPTIVVCVCEASAVVGRAWEASRRSRRVAGCAWEACRRLFRRVCHGSCASQAAVSERAGPRPRAVCGRFAAPA
jgi:hypothetical protein